MRKTKINNGMEKYEKNPILDSEMAFQSENEALQRILARIKDNAHFFVFCLLCISICVFTFAYAFYMTRECNLGGFFMGVTSCSWCILVTFVMLTFFFVSVFETGRSYKKLMHNVGKDGEVKSIMFIPDEKRKYVDWFTGFFPDYRYG